MPKYVFKVTLNLLDMDARFVYVVKDATLSDIFEAKRITDRIEDQYKKERLMTMIDEYRHEDEVEEVADLYELENELKSRIKSMQRHNQEVLDKLRHLDDLIESSFGPHKFSSADLMIYLTLFNLDQYFYFSITVDDFSDYKINLSHNDIKSSIIRRTANEVLAELTNVQDILTNIEKLANKTEFDLL